MQFEWWRKREEKREPAIRLVRNSSSGEGGEGAFGCYISVLEWCSVAPTVVYSVSFGQHIRKNMRASLPFSQSAKSVGIGMEFETLEFFFFFVSSFIVFTFRLYFSSTLYIASTIPRDISSSSSFSLLRFASQFASSFDIRHFIIVSFLFFLLDLRILSSSRYFIKFCIVFHTVFFSIKKKRKTRMEGRSIRRYLKRQFFGRRGQTGYELQSRTSTRPTFHV